uniref:DNA-directed RNA polymerase I subunit RPA49 n=1 Tax=Parastrongyloides trichosuri TaxID=131310 RepID=A0A0N4ZF14_PARTI
MGKESTSNPEYSDKDATKKCTERYYQESESEKDVVVMLEENRLKDTSSVTYKKIEFDNGTISYALNDPDDKSNCVNFGNVPHNSEKEYFIAYINKRTKNILYKPATLVKIKPQILENKEEFLKGKISRTKNYDYSKTNGIAKDEYLGKRNALTSDFGSIKKRKMLDDVVRRNIDQDTMLALADTAFASNTNVDRKPDINQSTVDALTSLGGKAQGDVAPQYNPNGKKPLEIWPIEQFFEDSTYDSASELCFEFFQDKTYDDLVQFGFPKLVAELVHTHLTDVKMDERLYLIMKLHYMIILYAHCKTLRSIDLKIISCDITPEIMRSQINGEFFDLTKLTQRGTIQINGPLKDKLASHILILYMLLNVPKHSIYINVAAKEFHISEMLMTRYLNKLGCAINKATPEEEVNYGAKKVGVLKSVPGKGAFMLKKKR